MHDLQLRGLEILTNKYPYESSKWHWWSNEKLLETEKSIEIIDKLHHIQLV